MAVGKWGLLTNHALVLIHVREHPRSTLREIANAVGITERATLSLLRGLEDEGIISRKKEGRRNRYWVNLDAVMDSQALGPYTIEEIIGAMLALTGREPRPPEIMRPVDAPP
ncbi:MAG TPA: helix-turn-helix domain-containing protein [Rubrobacteraceae bacterium]|nr:helix-turn-helix domain-containing protein [Rubrobacteraceae bacterium]